MGAAARRRAPRERDTRLTFTVWQFVRIMVRLEETSRADGSRPRDQLFRAWRESWLEVDRELTRLGEVDPKGFSDLMMSHDVVVSCQPGAQFNQAIKAIEEVSSQLGSAIAARKGGAEQLRHLRLERDELNKLKKRLEPDNRPQKRR